MDMPTYSDVFHSKVNIMHLDVYKPTNKCYSSLEQCFCTYIFCQNCSNSIVVEIGVVFCFVCMLYDEKTSWPYFDCVFLASVRVHWLVQWLLWHRVWVAICLSMMRKLVYPICWDDVILTFEVTLMTMYISILGSLSLPTTLKQWMAVFSQDYVFTDNF